jgi:hypothetical protein
MIRFVVARGHDYTLKNIRKAPQAPDIEALSYDELIRSRRLKRATYVFTDFDRLAYVDLELAGRIYLQLKNAGVKVLNNPARVKTRYSLLRALCRAGLNDFNVYRADECPVQMRFPVYIRQIRGHGRPCTDLLQTREQMNEAVEREIDAGLPAEHMMVIEYAGEPVRPNLYRKLAMFRIDSPLVPSPCVHDHQWMVKTGPNCIADEELYEEDFKNIRDNLYAEPLRKAFELAEIEYGRADFGFYQGRPQVFEINTNPHILAPKAHPSPVRRRTMDLAWAQTLQAFRAIDSPSGNDILLPKDHLLDRYRKWNRFLYRSRAVS